MRETYRILEAKKHHLELANGCAIKVQFQFQLGEGGSDDFAVGHSDEVAQADHQGGDVLPAEFGFFCSLPDGMKRRRGSERWQDLHRPSGPSAGPGAGPHLRECLHQVGHHFFTVLRQDAVQSGPPLAVLLQHEEARILLFRGWWSAVVLKVLNRDAGGNQRQEAAKSKAASLKK